MDPQVSTSFIPKKPLVPARARGSLGGLLVLVSILVLIASGVAAGAVFGYQQYLKSSIVSKSDSLQKAQAAYDANAIASLIRLDTRIKEAARVIDAHVAPSAIFTFLAEQTLEKVQLTSFDYQLQEDGVVDIAIEGTADTFSTLALQSDQFGSSDVLRDVIFSNILINPVNGKVNFTVHAGIDPAFILYSKHLRAQPPVIPAASESESVDATIGETQTQ